MILLLMYNFHLTAVWTGTGATLKASGNWQENDITLQSHYKTLQFQQYIQKLSF